MLLSPRPNLAHSSKYGMRINEDAKQFRGDTHPLLTAAAAAAAATVAATAAVVAAAVAEKNSTIAPCIFWGGTPCHDLVTAVAADASKATPKGFSFSRCRQS